VTAIELAGWSDQSLGWLLANRPDLLEPQPPESFDELAERAYSLASIARYLERANQPMIELVEIVAIAQAGTADGDLTELIGPADPGLVAAGLERLADAAILHRGPDPCSYRLAGSVRRRLDHPAGLGRRARVLLTRREHSELSAIARHLTVGCPEDDTRTALIAWLEEQLDDGDLVRSILANGPSPAADIAQAISAGDDPMLIPSPDMALEALEWLARHGLLIGDMDTGFEMPLEVGIALRGGRPHRCGPRLDEPVLERQPVSGALARSAVAHGARAAVERALTLLDEIARQPITTVRAGHVGIRELNRATAVTDVDHGIVAMLLELLWVAELIGLDPDSGEVTVTSAFHAWRMGTEAMQWGVLVEAWLGAPHHLSVVLPQTAKAKPQPLAPHETQSDHGRQRRWFLELLANIDDGQRASVPSIAELLTWREPALWSNGPRPATDLIRWLMAEAELIGLVGAGVAGEGLTAALAGDRDALAAAAGGLLPTTTGCFTVLGDLTAVAPAGLDRRIADRLGTLADVESRGGATMYRFSMPSVARAFDRGETAASLMVFLEGATDRDIPPSLVRLIADVGDRYGEVRIGAAGCYLRTEDDVVVASLLGDGRLAGLGLRQLGPGLLVAEGDSRQVRDELRLFGFLAAIEDRDGELIPDPVPDPNTGDRVTRSDVVVETGPARSTTMRCDEDVLPSDEQITAAIVSLRVAEPPDLDEPDENPAVRWIRLSALDRGVPGARSPDA